MSTAARSWVTVKVGGEPEGVERTPDGAFVYVTSEEDNEVFVIDPLTSKLVAQVKTSPRPRSVGFLPDGSRAYVTSETGNAIDVLDTRRYRVLTTIKLAHDLLRPMGIVVAPGGQHLYVRPRTRQERRHHRHQDQRGRVDDRSRRSSVGYRDVAGRPTLYTANGPSMMSPLWMSRLNPSRFASRPATAVGRRLRFGRCAALE